MPFENIKTPEDLLECLADRVESQYFKENFFLLYESSLNQNNYRLTNILLNEGKYFFLPGVNRTTYDSMKISDLFTIAASHKHFTQYFDLLYRNGYSPNIARSNTRSFEYDLLSTLFESEHYEGINYLIQKHDYPVVLNNNINCLNNICYEKNVERLIKFLEFNIQFQLSTDFFMNIENDNIENFFQCYTLLKEHPIYKNDKMFNEEMLMQDNLLTIIYKNNLSYDNMKKISNFMGITEISTTAFLNKEHNKKEQKGYSSYQNNSLKYMLEPDKINALLDLGFKENFLKADSEFENRFKHMLMAQIVQYAYSHEQLKNYMHFNLTETTDRGKYSLSDFVANSFYYFKQNKNIDALVAKFCFYFETDKLSIEQQNNIVNNFRYKNLPENIQHLFSNHMEKLFLEEHMNTINNNAKLSVKKTSRL